MKNRPGNCVKVLLTAFVAFTTINLFGCTIIAVGKKASADGSVIISHWVTTSISNTWSPFPSTPLQ